MDTIRTSQRAELPSSAQLVRSTLIALVTAVVLLVTLVLPSQYAIDPTGVGRMLRLTEAGQTPADAPLASVIGRTASLVIGSAHAGERTGAAPIVLAQAAPANRTDETVIALKPNEGTEYKIELPKGAAIKFSWKVEGGVVNYDMHGTPKGGGKESSYKQGRGVASEEGTLTAGFDGTHGWFFRNRGSAPVTVRLTTTGAYTAIKKVM
jgi:hypothetical protein